MALGVAVETAQVSLVEGRLSAPFWGVHFIIELLVLVVVSYGEFTLEDCVLLLLVSLLQALDSKFLGIGSPCPLYFNDIADKCFPQSFLSPSLLFLLVLIMFLCLLSSLLGAILVR